MASLLSQPRTRPRRIPITSAGFTIVETAVSAAVLVIGVLGLLASVTAGERLIGANREARMAYTAAQAQLAEMQALPLASVFARYNTATNDNPTGGVASPGPNFNARGLAACQTSPGGNGGSVRFPSLDGATLREDMVDAALGMPRDLDGDGIISSAPLTKPPLALPVIVRVEWMSADGPREISVRKILFGSGAP
ncbi:MAG: hypothetical protein JNL28_08525 [Planctomycetes bacterium]|nr:hypothetical protein [Planctomycetota bacterium]